MHLESEAMVSALGWGTGTISQTVEASKGNVYMMAGCDRLINTTHGTRKEDNFQGSGRLP